MVLRASGSAAHQVLMTALGMIYFTCGRRLVINLPKTAPTVINGFVGFRSDRVEKSNEDNISKTLSGSITIRTCDIRFTHL